MKSNGMDENSVQALTGRRQPEREALQGCQDLAQKSGQFKSAPGKETMLLTWLKEEAIERQILKMAIMP